MAEEDVDVLLRSSSIGTMKSPLYLFESSQNVSFRLGMHQSVGLDEQRNKKVTFQLCAGDVQPMLIVVLSSFGLVSRFITGSRERGCTTAMRPEQARISSPFCLSPLFHSVSLKPTSV